MMKNEKNKRGELTTTQLVTIIILIVSFIIILFLIFRLNPGEQTNKEICHNSVVLRAKSAVFAGPLDCRTNYLCISGGDDCSFVSASKIEVDLNKNDAEDKIKEFLAKEMADCWYMFGEGKVSYEGGFTERSVHCAVCSIVEFDEKIQEKFPKITYSELYDYLRKTKRENSQTYLKYLYDVNEVSLIPDAEYFNLQLDKEIDTSVKHSILTGVDMNIKLIFGEKDRYLSVFIIPTVETSSTECKEFITKP